MFPHSPFVMYEDFRENEIVNAGKINCLPMAAMGRISQRSILSARITAYEERKKYQHYYKAWEKLPEQKRPAFEKQYAFELRKYREAEAALQRWQDNGETINYKGWQKALKYLNTERMVPDIDLRDMKEDVRRLEVVKREYIKDNKQTKPERYSR